MALGDFWILPLTLLLDKVCGKQNGYAIGFYAGGLNREPTSTLYRIIYDEEKQKKAAREIAEATIQFYLEGLTGERLENPEQ